MIAVSQKGYQTALAEFEKLNIYKKKLNKMKKSTPLVIFSIFEFKFKDINKIE